uniref:Uncharacterized protein n=1 Tax=viral metagenome TaxID=1070528 RepID=A0A6M3L4V8_9ZZZZ
MKRAFLIIGILAAVSLCMAGIEDVELSASVGAGLNQVVTAACPAGHIAAIALDVAAGSTGNVEVAIAPQGAVMASRAIATTNDIRADVWLYPSDAGSRRYAVSDRDTFSMTVSNMTATAKQYRAVIRIETAK